MGLDATTATTADTEVRYLRSAIVGDEYKIFIAHPVPTVEPGKTYPVIYALDANGTFGMVTDGLRGLNLAGEVPPCYEEAYAAAHRDLPAKGFLCCGALENEQDIAKALAAMPTEARLAIEELTSKLWRARMVELLEPFVATLAGRNYRSLKIASHIFPDESRNSVYPCAVSRGLRTVFGRLG